MPKNLLAFSCLLVLIRPRPLRHLDTLLPMFRCTKYATHVSFYFFGLFNPLCRQGCHRWTWKVLRDKAGAETTGFGLATKLPSRLEPETSPHVRVLIGLTGHLFDRGQKLVRKCSPVREGDEVEATLDCDQGILILRIGAYPPQVAFTGIVEEVSSDNEGFASIDATYRAEQVTPIVTFNGPESVVSLGSTLESVESSQPTQAATNPLLHGEVPSPPSPLIPSVTSISSSSAVSCPVTLYYLSPLLF